MTEEIVVRLRSSVFSGGLLVCFCRLLMLVAASDLTINLLSEDL
jgi:hypothetical protein